MERPNDVGNAKKGVTIGIVPVLLPIRCALCHQVRKNYQLSLSYQWHWLLSVTPFPTAFMFLPLVRNSSVFRCSSTNSQTILICTSVKKFLCNKYFRLNLNDVLFDWNWYKYNSLQPRNTFSLKTRAISEINQAFSSNILSLWPNIWFSIYW